MRFIDDRERRARLAIRHCLAPEHRASDVVDAAAAVVALHATEAASVYLGIAARSDAITPDDIDRALYTDRSLVKHLAMRRTLWAFPRETLPAAWGSASARAAAAERRRLVKDVVAHGLADDGEAWLDRAVDAVERRLANGELLSASELRAQVPELEGEFEVSPAKAYGGTFHFAPRVLTVMGAEARLMRGTNSGHWRTSRPQWCLAETWLATRPDAIPAAKGYAELVHKWLAAFGPGSIDDIQWWLGSTKAAVRTALDDIGAVQVRLEREAVGWVLSDDVDSPPNLLEPWPALLPTLDPTLMGWKDRAHYLSADHVPYLFDSNGNGGTTAWWDGTVVGCWVQDPDGAVRTVLLDDVGADASHSLEIEAARLTRWLDGTIISSVYASQLMKRGRLP